MGKHGMESTWTFVFGWFTWSWSVVLSRGKGNDTCWTAGACVQMLCVHLQHQQGWWGGHGGLKVLSLLSIDHVTLFRHKALQQTTHPLIREQKRYSTVTTFQQHGSAAGKFWIKVVKSRQFALKSLNMESQKRHRAVSVTAGPHDNFYACDCLTWRMETMSSPYSYFHSEPFSILHDVLYCSWMSCQQLW